jgi:actin-like ATPase involved in cell morphogenesis
MELSGTIQVGLNDCIENIIEKVNSKLHTEITAEVGRMLFNRIASLLSNDTQFVKFYDLEISADLVRGAIYPVYEEIIGAMNKILSVAEVETLRAIKDNGVYLGGVGSGIRGLSDLIRNTLGLETFLPELPENALIYGAGGLLSVPEVMNKIVENERKYDIM